MKFFLGTEILITAWMDLPWVMYRSYTTHFLPFQLNAIFDNDKKPGGQIIPEDTSINVVIAEF